jgi:hypothetical protein
MPSQTPSLTEPQPSIFIHQGYHIPKNRNKPHPNPSTITTNMPLTLLENFIPITPIKNAHTLHIIHIKSSHPFPANAKKQT